MVALRTFKSVFRSPGGSFKPLMCHISSFTSTVFRLCYKMMKRALHYANQVHPSWHQQPPQQDKCEERDWTTREKTPETSTEAPAGSDLNSGGRRPTCVPFYLCVLQGGASMDWTLVSSHTLSCWGGDIKLCSCLTCMVYPSIKMAPEKDKRRHYMMGPTKVKMLHLTAKCTVNKTFQ